jgi:TRAP-type C4-dicarboxylate transport system permease small subunit
MQDHLSLAFFAVMCVLILLQLASRYVFNRPFLFTEEFSRFCYVWIAFLGLAIGHRSDRNDHIRVDLFSMFMPPWMKKAARYFIAAVSIVLLVYLTYWGIRYLEFNQYSVAASVRLPLVYVYAALPLGCVLGVVNIVCGLLGK